MHSFLITFLRTGLPFGVFMGIFLSFQSGAQFGIPAGLTAGVFFGLSMAAFARYQESKARANPPLFIDEERLIDGAANHFAKKIAFGGWMYLTDKQLFFKGHSGNLRAHELSVPIEQISEAKKAKSLGILSNQLHLTLNDGSIERFVVHDADGWVREIMNLRQKYLDGPRADDARLFS
jgi:hypothetical protein